LKLFWAGCGFASASILEPKWQHVMRGLVRQGPENEITIRSPEERAIEPENLQLPVDSVLSSH